jgi:hypothetical protein
LEKAGHFEETNHPYLQGQSNLLSAWPTLWSQRRRWYIPPKFCAFPELHSITTQSFSHCHTSITIVTYNTSFMQSLFQLF